MVVSESSAASRPTISVIVPALNEEGQIREAVREAEAALVGHFADWEMLLFDDGSKDSTGTIMDELALGDPRRRVTHNPYPHNLGGVYRQGVAMARHEYLMMVPGDNENPGSALAAPFAALGQADIVLPFPTNSRVRGLFRQFASRAYTGLMNLLFGLNVRYYNGTVIHRTVNLRSITIETASFAYQSEILVKMLRAGKSYVEVGIEIEPPQAGRRSRALRWKNLREVLRTVGRLFVDLRLRSSKPAGKGAR